MNNLFSLLFIASIVLFVVGLSSPDKSLFWYNGDRTKARSKRIYGVLIFLFFILLVSSPQKESVTSHDSSNLPNDDGFRKRNNDNDNSSEMPLEQKLAVLDAGTYVAVTDSKVSRIKSLLNDLSSMYKESKDSIAEYTSKAQGVLHDKGINESCLNILRGMRKAGKVENTSYREAVTLYIMIEDYSQ